MSLLSHTSRRRRRRVSRRMIHKDLLTLDLTPEEILDELEPCWFHFERDGEPELAKQVQTDEAAA